MAEAAGENVMIAPVEMPIVVDVPQEQPESTTTHDNGTETAPEQSPPEQPAEALPGSDQNEVQKVVEVVTAETEIKESPPTENEPNNPEVKATTNGNGEDSTVQPPAEAAVEMVTKPAVPEPEKAETDTGEGAGEVVAKTSEEAEGVVVTAVNHDTPAAAHPGAQAGSTAESGDAAVAKGEAESNPYLEALGDMKPSAADLKYDSNNPAATATPTIDPQATPTAAVPTAMVTSPGPPMPPLGGGNAMPPLGVANAVHPGAPEAAMPPLGTTAEVAAAAAAAVTATTTTTTNGETGQPVVEITIGDTSIKIERPVHKKKGEVLKRRQDVTTVVTRNGKTWNEMFDILVKYKSQYGDTFVPDRFKWEGVCLGLWVRNQRRREASLTDEQHKRLTELGLDWQTQNERFDNVWHERFAKLTEYRCEHGDCKVPYTYKKDPALAKWVSQQRAQQAQGRLAPERKKKLDSIQFSWKLNTVKNRNTKTEDMKWQRQFEKLVTFHQQHGHCKVPDRYKPDRPLGTWVKKQRLANACNQLKEERKRMLDELNFVWRITDKTDGEKWDKMFQSLKKYKEENGTCHVSRTVPDGDLKPLARWVKTQRALYKSGKILEDRKERLESINFVWDGTQLPIKRKRRRHSEEGEQAASGEPPAKQAKVEDAAADTKEGDDDKKMPAAKDPPQPKVEEGAAEGLVIVDAEKVDESDMKPKATTDADKGAAAETSNTAAVALPAASEEVGEKQPEATIPNEATDTSAQDAATAMAQLEVSDKAKPPANETTQPPESIDKPTVDQPATAPEQQLPNDQTEGGEKDNQPMPTAASAGQEAQGGDAVQAGNDSTAAADDKAPPAAEETGAPSTTRRTSKRELPSSLPTGTSEQSAEVAQPQAEESHEEGDHKRPRVMYTVTI